MEIETPSKKEDLIRLKDAYGREKEGYEGIKNMSKKLHQYQYIKFQKDEIINSSRKKIGKTEFYFAEFHSKTIFDNMHKRKCQKSCFLLDTFSKENNASNQIGEIIAWEEIVRMTSGQKERFQLLICETTL